MNDRIYRAIATIGPIGYVQASGPLASFLGISAACALSQLFAPTHHIIFLIVLCLASWYCIGRALYFFKETDPREIVLDEICGICCAFFAPSQLSGNFSIAHCFLLFLFFRFFDATKWFGISRIERIPGAAGVLFDDVIAGIYARILFALCMFIFPF